MAIKVGSAASKLLGRARVRSGELNPADFPNMADGAEVILLRAQAPRYAPDIHGYYAGGVVLGNVEDGFPDMDEGEASMVDYFDEEGDLVSKHQAKRAAARDWKALNRATRIDRRGDRQARRIINELADADGEPRLGAAELPDLAPQPARMPRRAVRQGLMDNVWDTFSELEDKIQLVASRLGEDPEELAEMNWSMDLPVRSPAVRMYVRELTEASQNAAAAVQAVTRARGISGREEDRIHDALEAAFPLAWAAVT